MTLVPLPAPADNNIWLPQDAPQAIDRVPGNAGPLFDALARSNLKLAAILVTHHGTNDAVDPENKNARIELAVEPAAAHLTHSVAQRKRCVHRVSRNGPSLRPAGRPIPWKNHFR
jgi:hypothetical protein